MPLPEKTNNKFYPLPKDYLELTEEGQREARVNACSSWYDLKKPKDIISDPDAFVTGFRFFKEYYRKGWRGNQAKYYLDSPKFHDDWIRDVAFNPHIIITSFRSSGKTIVFGEELPEFLVVTRPNTPITYTSSTDKLTTKQVRAVRMDIEQNELIHDDFGGLVPPNQRSLKWTQEQIELTNHSAMIGVSADQAQRGITALSLRPVVQILDDWEMDKRMRNTDLLSNAEDWLFDVFFPCALPWARRMWANTFLSIFSWAMKASKKEDERFKHWHSVQYNLLNYNEDNELESIWPEYISSKEALQMASEGSKSIVGFGKKSFSGEFMNDPTSKSETALNYDDRFHGFDFEVTRSERNVVKGNDRFKYSDLAERSVRVVGVDLALGVPGGDFSAIVVAGLDEKGTLWLLDEYVQRERPVQTIAKTLSLATEWDCDFIGIERIHFDQIAIDMLQAEIEEKRAVGLHAPQVNVIKRGGGKSKDIRIMGLQYRFEGNKVMLNRACTSSIDQIRYWTPTGGKLKHDDILDALVCCEETFLKLGGPAYFQIRPPKTDIEMYKDAVKMGIRPNPGLEHLPLEAIREERMRPAPDPSSDDFASIFMEDWDDQEYFGAVR